MPDEYLKISSADTAKILALVQEYADKLRALCVAYVDARAKRQQIILLSATLMTVIVTATLIVGRFYVNISDLNSSSLPIVAALLGASVSILPLMWIGSPRRSRDIYDVHQVARTVERLLRTASQYAEHSTQALGDKFEFDIRLAEAEGALHAYYSIFEQRDKRERNFG